MLQHFFFHGRGVFIQKSPLGLYRIIFYQILQRISDLLRELTSLLRKRCQTEGPFGEWTWQKRDLQDFLEFHIKNAAGIYTIRIYIDALDECGEEVATDLVNFLNRFITGSEVSLAICFSCRHRPLITLENGDDVCVDDENDQDISIYIKNHIETRIRPRANMEMLRD